MRRFDPDAVHKGHIYKEGEVLIYWVFFDILCGLG